MSKLTYEETIEYNWLRKILKPTNGWFNMNQLKRFYNLDKKFNGSTTR